MKLLLTTIAAVVLVGCGPSGIHKAAANGNIEAVKQYLDGGADVNAKDGGDGLLCIMRLRPVTRKSLNC